MFEKEAEDFAIKECCLTCSIKNPYSCEEKCECWIFATEGVKFGYNKAKEWQYVKEGCKYPENGESVLVTVLDDDNEKIVTMALFEVENNKRFWDIESRLCSVHSGSEEVCSKIIAWARVLPAGGEK